jgi:hypothetical protein
MKLTQEQLEAIRQRAENATPGPWEWSGDKFGDIVVYSPERRGFHNNGGEIAQLDFGSQSDATFIAHARTDIPALLEHIAELEAELGKYRKILHGELRIVVKKNDVPILDLDGVNLSVEKPVKEDA